MPKIPTKSQSEKFREAAKKAACSEDEAAFNEKLKKLIKSKNKTEPTQKG